VRGRRLLLGMFGIVLVAALLIFIPSFVCRPSDPKLDDLGEVPAFALVDDTGQPFTQDALRGHPTIVHFVFTRCDTICPVTTMKLANIQEKTFDVRSALKLASFSVDPEYDTPERLAAYAKAHHADPTRWRFVTGPVDQMRALVEGPFMNSMKREGVTASGAPSIGHSGYFLLVDGRLHIRGAYDSGDINRLEDLMRDARYLVRTSR
jgi:protein SCO1